MKRRALFLDRDGLIIHMVLYPYGYDSAQKYEDLKLVDGIQDVIKTAHDKGLIVIEITNQPGVAKGTQTQELSDAIETKVHELLGNYDLDAVYVCPHHPRGVVSELTIDCDCRKPKPGLLLQATKEHDIDLENSLFYGDKATDVEAGKAAGCKTMLLLHNEDTPEKVEEARRAEADYKVKSHKEALEVISKF